MSMKIMYIYKYIISIYIYAYIYTSVSIPIVDWIVEFNLYNTQKHQLENLSSIFNFRVYAVQLPISFKVIWGTLRFRRS